MLPTWLRLGAHEHFTGRGVTIAFLDSGFYPHPDLTTPHSRILEYHNIVPKGTGTLDSIDVASWHGMMTSVVAAGNGALSGGFFRSIAPDCNVVLVKVSKSGHIGEKNIERGLRWIIENREKYGIRVVNISAGGDGESLIPRQRPLPDGRARRARGAGRRLRRRQRRLGAGPSRSSRPPRRPPASRSGA